MRTTNHALETCTALSSIPIPLLHVDVTLGLSLSCNRVRGHFEDTIFNSTNIEGLSATIWVLHLVCCLDFAILEAINNVAFCHHTFVVFRACTQLVCHAIQCLLRSLNLVHLFLLHSCSACVAIECLLLCLHAFLDNFRLAIGGD